MDPEQVLVGIQGSGNVILDILVNIGLAVDENQAFILQVAFKSVS